MAPLAKKFLLGVTFRAHCDLCNLFEIFLYGVLLMKGKEIICGCRCFATSHFVCSLREMTVTFIFFLLLKKV
jgi:hypothetical protein